MQTSFQVVALLAGCAVDGELVPKEGEPPPFDSAATVTLDTAVDSVPPPPEEVCNGVDDDGDGLADEGFPDADGNGRVDCLDLACPTMAVGVAADVPIDPATEAAAGGGSTAPVDDPWNVVEQWRFLFPAADPTAINAWSPPMIGNLDDDDGDGVVDAHDSPDVVVVVHGATAWIVAMEGATGTEKWAYADGNHGATTVIADVTGDGEPDVVTVNSAGFTVVLDATGALQWTATEAAAVLGYFELSAADLDEDGQPEVIADNLVLDGATGTLRWEMRAFGNGCPYTHAAVGDIDDADGDQEVIYCGVVYDSDGTVLWDSGERGGYGMWPFLIQADTDPQAEIGFVGDRLTLWDADGTNRFSVDYEAAGPFPGPPCAGDFDGDGAAEVVFPAYPYLWMYELDGTAVWSAPMDDVSGLSGCSGFDVDGDGRLEVLYADQGSMNILDGATGARRFETRDHTSYTALEYPTVADIDGDGSAEILTVNNWGDHPAVIAYQHGGAGWPAAGPTWAVYDYAMTNLDADGAVPRRPEHSWEKYNLYRARTAVDGASAWPDLRVSITDVCLMDCTYGPGVVAVQVRNEGAADVPAGVLLTLYEERATGPAVVGTVTLPEVWAGRSLDGVAFPLTLGQFEQAGFTAVVDDDGAGAGAVDEWDEGNNRDEWNDGGCP